MGETIFITLKELENILDDDGFEVDLFLIIKVLSL